jgi:hypothetical protein
MLYDEQLISDYVVDTCQDYLLKQGVQFNEFRLIPRVSYAGDTRQDYLLNQEGEVSENFQPTSKESLEHKQKGCTLF